MRIVFILLLVLTIAGGAYYWFFMREGQVTIGGSPYPKNAAGLEAPITITKEKGIISIAAASRLDLFFAQGLHHGLETGAALAELLALFKGGNAENLGSDLSGLASLFYYLDLEYTATDSLALYPIDLQVILRRYAEGLSEGSGDDWRVEDVLLMQRGYAFLMGHGFAAEWTANRLSKVLGQETFSRLSGYPPGKLGGMPDGLELPSIVEPILLRPSISLARYVDDQGTVLQQGRTINSLDFVFQPMRIKAGDSLSASGISLAGIPFLWSGVTHRFSFCLQPILANDEQFYVLPENLFLGDPDLLFRNDAATHAANYPGPPVHGDYGRRMDRFLGGTAGAAVFYDWDGFRPSADLASLYFILVANDPAEARAALQYHQVPAVDVILRAPLGRPTALRLLPSDPNGEEEIILGRSRLFRGPEVTRIRPAQGARGFDFEHAVSMPGESSLDNRLADLLGFYLEGPLAASVDNEETGGPTLASLLRGEKTVERTVFLQAVWHALFVRFERDFLENTRLAYLDGADLALKRFLLASLDREGIISANSGQNATGARSRIVEEVVAEARSAIGDSSAQYLVRQDGDWTASSFNIPGLSPDAVPAPLWVTTGEHAALSPGLTFILEEEGTFMTEGTSKIRTWTINPSN